MRRWFQKIVQVFVVIALGAFASLPFRRLPPPGQPGDGSADRLVLQNESARIVPDVPLQIAPPPDAVVGAPTGPASAEPDRNAPRTAANPLPQASRKDLPAWNSRLESNEPPPPLPDAFDADGRATTSSTLDSGASPSTESSDLSRTDSDDAASSSIGSDDSRDGLGTSGFESSGRFSTP